MPDKTTIREQLIADGSLKEQSWDEWKRDLVACAAADDMGAIDPDDYRDFYDDGYTAADAWAEDMQNG